MTPTYPERGFTFCWRPAFWFRAPRHGDVVMLRYVGRRVALLKRIAGLPGDTLAFSNGQLIRNGLPVEEPWIGEPADWNMESRSVPDGHVYVIGDNRRVNMDQHMFGAISMNRLLGTPLW